MIRPIPASSVICATNSFRRSVSSACRVFLTADRMHPPTECPTCTIAETRTVYTGCELGGLRGSRRALHPGRAFAQEPALEFAARDHDLPRPSAYRGVVV